MSSTSAVLVHLTRTCPTCTGGGEVGTTQDYFGNWDTTRCRECQGRGEVDALLWEATHCAHDVHAEDDCTTCRAESASAGDYTLADNPWANGTSPVAGGWDAEPPF